MYQLHEAIYTLNRPGQCPMNALLIDGRLVSACAIQWAPHYLRRFITGMVPTVPWIFLPYTYAIMADETEVQCIRMPESNIMALRGATQRSFDIIVPLSNAR